jgi:hypothetical protein
MKMSVEHSWNDSDSEKPQYSDKNLSQCHFVNHKSHMDWPGIEIRPPQWSPTTNRLSHGTAFAVLENGDCLPLMESSL